MKMPRLVAFRSSVCFLLGLLMPLVLPTPVALSGEPVVDSPAALQVRTIAELVREAVDQASDQAAANWETMTELEKAKVLAPTQKAPTTDEAKQIVAEAMKDAQRWQAAARSIANLTREQEDALRKQVAALGDEAEALGQPAVPELVQLVKRHATDPQAGLLVAWATNVLRELPQTSDEFLELSHLDNAVVKAWALDQLGRNRSPQAVACASELLSDPSPFVRRSAAAALGRTATDAVPPVLRELAESDPDFVEGPDGTRFYRVREAAERALIEIESRRADVPEREEGTKPLVLPPLVSLHPVFATREKPEGALKLTARIGGERVWIDPMPILTNRSLVEAKVEEGQSSGPTGYGVHLKLSHTGAVIFARYTAAHDGDGLALLVNGELISAPVIHGRILGHLVISGLTQEQATDLATRINEAVKAAPPDPRP